MRRALGWLSAAGVAGLALAAAVHAFLGAESAPSSGSSSDLRQPARIGGPDVPPAGALSGTILLAGADGCLLASLDLATLTLTGDSVEPSVETRAGCPPARTEEGDVLTIVDGPERVAVLRNGDVLLDEPLLRSGFAETFDGHVQPLGLDQRADGLLAVAVAAAPLDEATLEPRPDEPVQPGPFGALARGSAGTLPLVRLQLWRGTSLDRVIALPAVGYDDGQARFGDTVSFSPDGKEVAVAASQPGTQLAVVDLRSGRAVLPRTRQLGFTWSPDGAWLALAGREEIELYGSVRDEPVFRIPVSAFGLAWR